MAWTKKKIGRPPKQVEPDESKLPELPKPTPVPTPPKVVENESKEEESNNKVMIVRELPNQEVRNVMMQDGSRADLMTIEEALEVLLEKVDTLLERTEE